MFSMVTLKSTLGRLSDIGEMWLFISALTIFSLSNVIPIPNTIFRIRNLAIPFFIFLGYIFINVVLLKVSSVLNVGESFS